MDDNIYSPPWGLSTLAKEFSAAARIMQSSSNELNTLVSGKVLFTNPSARAGYDTRSIFKRSLTGLNSEFSFS